MHIATKLFIANWILLIAVVWCDRNLFNDAIEGLRNVWFIVSAWAVFTIVLFSPLYFIWLIWG